MRRCGPCGFSFPCTSISVSPWLRWPNSQSITLDREILAQRVALVIGRRQYPAQIRVAVEGDAEHVINLALQPVRRFPQFPHRRQARVVLFEEDLHPKPVIVYERVEV